MNDMGFIFGNKGMVRAGCRYLPGGFGFVTEKERTEQENLRIFELNSGFDVPYWYREDKITLVSECEDGCYVDSDKLVKALWEKDSARPGNGERRIPLCFKATLPEAGNYKVSVTLKAVVDEEEILLFGGRRHLAWKGRMRAGEQEKQSFVVNICDIIPNGRTQIYEDRTLNIAIVGNCPVLQEVKVTKIYCPTAYLAGDSTMADYGADYPYHPAACYGGWGQAFDAWIRGDIAVCNQAHNGRTTESFRTEGHYGIVSKHIRKGDYFLIQFGHNDQKHQHLRAEGGYAENLKRFVGDIREKGAFPIILTPIARNTWKEEDGELVYNDLLCEYSDVCTRIGKEQGIPVLDLHGESMAGIMELGQDASKIYYHVDDWTHTNDYGAYRAAGYVAGELVRQRGPFPEYAPLMGAVGKGFGSWIPQGDIPLLKKPGRLEHIRELQAEDGGEAARNHQAEKEGWI